MSLHPGKHLLFNEISRWVTGKGAAVVVGKTRQWGGQILLPGCRISGQLLMMLSHPQQTMLAFSRKEMAKEGLAGYVVPSTDAHQVAVETCLYVPV